MAVGGILRLNFVWRRNGSGWFFMLACLWWRCAVGEGSVRMDLGGREGQLQWGFRREDEEKIGEVQLREGLAVAICGRRWCGWVERGRRRRRRRFGWATGQTLQGTGNEEES
ncbi:unnamed protein product [Dovyalis caffra]|uniref:Secreted protein n=1 Tax=Dovyalis caffra TaxID=77055 RepID=A0AAV1QTI4_9ROSI|nr:unnamed protein product [Dovyalis caffra]